MVIKNIKRLGGITALSFSIISVVHATAAGFYMGGQLGATKFNTGTQTLQKGSTPSEQVSPSNTGLGARIFAGYAMNPYFSGESGYTYYTRSKYNGTYSSGTIRQGVWDLLLKGSWPISTSGISVFAKAGLAAAITGVSSSITSSNIKSGYALPTIGAGVSYDMTQQWVADLTYMTIPKRSSYPGSSFLALGISYHFVDVYCGQFLC